LERDGHSWPRKRWVDEEPLSALTLFRDTADVGRSLRLRLRVLSPCPGPCPPDAHIPEHPAPL